jgi:hypothetical protein
MSRSIDAAVPEPLHALLELDPGDAAVDGFTLLLLTPREDGWCHQAMLSVGEVACRSDRTHLRLAVWPGSTSTRNMRAAGRATLTAVVEGVSYALFLTVEEVSDGPGGLARFDARVAAATADEAPYARLEHGVRYTLIDRDDTLARWRATREALAG